MPFGEARTLGFNNQVINRLIAGNIIITPKGLFMFSSLPPAKGNLVLAFAPAAGGSIGGNTYPQGFNFGVWDNTGTLKQHFGIDNNGKLYLADNTGTTRVYEDPSFGAQVFYDPTGLALGHQLVSVAANAFTDPAGNVIQRGVVAYGLSNPATQYAQLIGAALDFFDTVNAATAPGQIGLTSVTTSDDATQVLSPLSAASDVQAGLVLQRAATPGPAHAMINNADFRLADAASVQPGAGILLHSKSGQPRVFSSRTGDTNDYSYGSALAIASATTNIASLTEIVLTGLTLPVGIGTYRITGVVRGINGANVATQAVGIDGPAASNVNVDVKVYSATAGTFKQYGEITSLGGRVSTASLAAAEAFQAEYDGLITFTAAGTLELTGSCVTSAVNGWTSQARSRLRIEPYL